MAAFEDRRGPDLDQFVGRKWTDWLSAIQSSEPKQQSATESTSTRDVEVARLRKNDMGLFGHRPATDKFFLVVCEHCGQFVKPQSLNIHYERKHKSKRILRMPVTSSRKSSHGHVKHIPKLNHCLTSPENSQKQHSSHNAVGQQLRGSSHAVRHPGVSSRPKVLAKAETLETRESGPGKGFVEPSPKNHRPEKGTKLIPPQPAKVHSSGGHDNMASSSVRSHKAMQGKVAGKTIKMTDVPENDITRPSALHVPEGKHHNRHHNKTFKNEPRPVRSEISRNTERRPSDKSNAEVSSPNGKNKRVYHTHHHHHHQPLHDTSSDGGNVSLDVSDVKPLSSEQRIISHSVPMVVLEKTQLTNPGGIVKLSQAHKRSRQASGGSESPSSPPKNKVQVLHSPTSDKPSTDMGVAHRVPNSVLPVKPKKKDKRNIPLKAREYDSNRHCGVWLAEDNSRCRRSLTCKVHPLSAKRSVPGRRKPFDELVQEHGREKLRLKEKNLAAASGAVPTSPTNILQKPFTRPPEFAVPSTSVSVRLKSVPSTTTMTTTASVSTSQTTATATKAKTSLNLFPKNFAPWRVDCWDDHDDVTEELPKSHQSCVFTYRHPQPLAACQFSARRFGACQVSYDRKVERQLESLSSNIYKFGAKSQKNPKPFSFTPLSVATVRQVPARISATLPQPSLNQAACNNQVSLPPGPPQPGEPKNRRLSSQAADVPRQQAMPFKTGRTNVVRKTSTPATNVHRASTDSLNNAAADIRNRSKSEQVTNLLRRTISGGAVKHGTNATWAVPQATDSNTMTTSNYFMNDTLHVNNSSPSPLTISSTPSIVPIPTDTSSDVHRIGIGRSEEQARLKKISEKRKNSMSRSPKPLSHKVNSKSAMVHKYALEQSLVNSYQTEQLDGSQITVQLPNGLNRGNVLLKPGSHSVTLSGNIGALTVAGDDPDSLSTFTGNQISKRYKNMNSNNNFVTQNQGVPLVTQTTANAKHFPQIQQNMVHQTEISQVDGGLPDNLILQNDDPLLLSPSYGHEVGNGSNSVLLNQYPNVNYADSSMIGQQQVQPGQSPDVMSLLRQSAEQTVNRAAENLLNKHSLQLNVADLGQLDLGKVIMNVNNNPSMHGQYAVGSEEVSYDLLQGSSVDLTTCSSSANAKRTSDISQNFITQ